MPGLTPIVPAAAESRKAARVAKVAKVAFALPRAWACLPPVELRPARQAAKQQPRSSGLTKEEADAASDSATDVKRESKNRGDRIRTCDLVVPNHALYQA